MLRLTLLACVVFSLCSSSTLCAPAAEYSQLWGRQGELWRADGRLPDFSYAGYHRGERPLPAVDVVADVTSFGADGRDTRDSRS